MEEMAEEPNKNTNPEAMAAEPTQENTTEFSNEPIPQTDFDWTTPKNHHHANHAEARKRMATITFKPVPNDNESPQEAHKRYIKKIATDLGINNIAAIYANNNGTITVATNTEKQLEQITQDQQQYNITITPIIRKNLLITLECPYYIDDEEIESELEKFGHLRGRITRERYRWAPDIQTGKRKCHITPTKNILNLPHYITLDRKRTTIYYKGKGFFCRSCGENKPHNHECPSPQDDPEDPQPETIENTNQETYKNINEENNTQDTENPTENQISENPIEISKVQSSKTETHDIGMWRDNNEPMEMQIDHEIENENQSKQLKKNKKKQPKQINRTFERKKTETRRRG